MIIDSKSILKSAAVYGAVAALVTGAWAFGDNTGYRPWLKREQQEFTSKDFHLVMEQTQINTLAIAKQEFNLLEEKAQRGGELTYEEKRDLCKNAQILEYPVEGCQKDTGEPILVTRSKVK